MNKEIKNKRQFIVSNSQEHKGLIAKRSYNEQWTMADAWLSLGMEWISLNIKRLLEFRWNAEADLVQRKNRKGCRMRRKWYRLWNRWNGMWNRELEEEDSYAEKQICSWLRFGWKKMEMAMVFGKWMRRWGRKVKEGLCRGWGMRRRWYRGWICRGTVEEEMAEEGAA